MRIAINNFATDDSLINNICQKLKKRCPEGLSVGAVMTYKAENPIKVIDRIMKVADQHEIHILRFYAHGNSGRYYFPGLYFDYAICMDYSRLLHSGRMHPSARIELHGCGMASETSILKPGVSPIAPKMEDTIPGTFTGRADGPGLTYLRRVAAVFGVSVSAPVNAQPPGATDWRFDGPTVTVLPNGKFRYDSDETRDWDIAATTASARKEMERIRIGYIQSGKLTQARSFLQELVRNYPRTEAAKEALDRLNDEKLRSTQEIEDAKFPNYQSL